MKDGQIKLGKSSQFTIVRLSLTHRKKIEQYVGKFVYKQQISYEQNMIVLCDLLFKALNLNSDMERAIKQPFLSFVTNEYNIPIQINFKNLKFEQLICLFEQWWQHKIEQPTQLRASDRLYSLRHRNILFSRVFVEQKSNIEQYFSTLSEKNMLKPVDLYQLLLNILSHYYLYEYKSDNETFFQKINSFNNFLQIVQKFKHSQSRIIIDNKCNDFDYIKIYQFAALINFWQITNPQLQLCSAIRFSIRNMQVQTEKHFINNTLHKEVQTIQHHNKQTLLTLQQVINCSLKMLNRLTQHQNGSFKLQIIQNLCQNLRKQKIQLSKYQQNQILIPQLSFNDFDQNKIQIQSQSQKTQKITINNLQRFDEIKQFLFQNVDPDKIQLKKHKEQLGHKKLSITSANYKQYQKIHYQKKLAHVAQKSEKDMIILIPQNKQPIQKNKQPMQKKKQPIQKNEQPLLKNEQALLKNQLFSQIYNNYLSRDQIFNIHTLKQFLINIGFIQQGQTNQLTLLLDKNVIRSTRNIAFDNFIQIMIHIMNQDPELTYQVIKEFADLYLNSKSNTISLNKTNRNNQRQINEPYKLSNSKSKNSSHTNQKRSHQNSMKFKYFEQRPLQKQSLRISPSKDNHQISQFSKRSIKRFNKY